jgi:vacuolar-type H+-ATPase subunit F/Vma7
VSRIAAIGESGLLDGYGLTGVRVHPAEDAVAAQRAWEALGADVGLLLLTPRARAALASELADAHDLVWTVIPE